MRLRHLVPTLAGAAAALLLGSGVLALVTDSVTSPGNRVRSPALENPIDLVVGHTSADSGGRCEDFSDTTTVPMRFSADPADTEGELPQDDTLTPDNAWCVRNVGTEAITVWMDFTNVLSTDAGCASRESEVDGDCASQESVGELQDGPPTDGNLMVTPLLSGSGSRPLSFGCWAGVGSGCGPNQAFRMLFELEPGQTEIVALTFDWNDDVRNDPLARRRSQTDALQWDVVFRTGSLA
jgi:hypothetical protein